MKIQKIPFLLFLIITFNYESAKAKTFDDLKLYGKSFSSCDIKSSPISVSPVTNNLPNLTVSSAPTCTYIRSAKELYELWIKNNPKLTPVNLEISKLEPQPNDKEKEWFLKIRVVQKFMNDNKDSAVAGTAERCGIAMLQKPGKEYGEYPACTVVEKELAVTRTQIVTDDKDYQATVIKGIFERGKKLSEQSNKKNVKEVPPPQVTTTQNTMTKECKEKLSAEIAELLGNKSKNIIGLQFELTVLKMASLSVSEGEKTFEGLIKKKSKELKAIDDGSIDKMNQLYKKHGLPEDASKITDVLKVKASDSNYYNRHKRFFNNDSSAFMMAYQQIHPKSPIKEADISVLWFMDQVSKKAKEEYKEFQSEHNRTNLSTRIAQYTGAIDPKKLRDQTELDAMVVKQKQKIDTEFLALIEKFKRDNSQCFNSGDSGDSECNLIKVEEIFGNLLAINSKIASTDVFVEKNLSGKINQATFSIARYVDSP